MPRGGGNKGRVKSGLEFVFVLAAAIGLALGIQAFLVKPYRIPSRSMVPTLEVGQRVLANRIGTHFGSPSVGDIVVFHPPVSAQESSVMPSCARAPATDAACAVPGREHADVAFIKRVVAVGGDRISIRDGHVVRNGKRQADPFEGLNSCEGMSDSGCNLPSEITIPPGHLFMMGDNRGDSNDSRFWGPIPEDWVIGRAVGSYWPPKHVGPL